MKSSQAWAPQDSFRFSHENINYFASPNKFSNSIASIKSEFHINPQSLIPISQYIEHMFVIFLHPSSSKSWILNTAACLYIVSYIYDLILAVDKDPFEYLILSSHAIDSSPTPRGRSSYYCPGLYNLAVYNAAALPKTTRSSNELAPNLFAPWALAQATSPAAISPLTISSLPYQSYLSTSVFQLVGIPPIL